MNFKRSAFLFLAGLGASGASGAFGAFGASDMFGKVAAMLLDTDYVEHRARMDVAEAMESLARTERTAMDAFIRNLTGHAEYRP